jgi:hypothetical protein
MPCSFERPYRILPDGRWLFLMPLIFGRARLGIGPAGSLQYDDVY